MLPHRLRRWFNIKPILGQHFVLNPYPAKLIYLNFLPLEGMSRSRDPQLQVSENYSYLFNLSTNFCRS